MSTAEQIAVAAGYLQALITRDGASVKFHPDAVRYEARIKTGFSGRHLRRSLNKGLQYRLVSEIRDVKWTGEGDQVIADFVLIAQAFGRTLQTLRIHEIFLIPADDPRIRRIDVHFKRAKETS